MSKTKQTKRVTPASSDTLLPILEALPSAFFVLDETDTIVYANTSAQAMLGTPSEAFHGSSFWHCAPELVSPALYQAVRKTKQTRALTEVEYVSPVTQSWLRVHLAPTVGGLTLQFHEGREPARRQEMFPQGEHLCLDNLGGLQTRIAILTPEGIVLDITAIPLNEAQVRREEVIGKPLAEAPWWSFSPASQEQLRAAIARASTGETVRFEALIRPREGMDLHLEGVITPHVDADHQIGSLVIVGIDITARRRADEAIHTLIDAIPQFVWIARPDGYITYNNQRLIDFLAMTHEQAEGDGWMVGVHPDDRQRVWQAWQTSLQTGMPFEMEYRVQDGASGTYRWFLVRGVPQRNAQGTILHWVGTCTDIDEQKRAEKQLKESRENLRVLAETVPQLVWTTQPDGSVTYWNHQWYDYTSASPDQSLGQAWSRFLHPDDAQHTLTVWHQAIETGEAYEIAEQIVDANDTFLRMTGYTREDLRAGHLNWLHITPPEYQARTLEAHQELATQQTMVPYEQEFVCQDGSRLPVLVCGVGFQHHARQGIICVLDNSARKELEQRKDDFISMASHELKTPLTAVKMQTQLVRKRLEKQSQHEAAIALSRVEGPVKQLERLIGELLDVSKIQAGRLEYLQEPVDLDALLREIVETMQHLHPSHTLVVRGAVRASLIGDRGRLGQVFTNLLSNAIKYSPDAETVEMDLSTSPEMITVRVRDHGLGIPREQRDKIFERFYRASTFTVTLPRKRDA